MHKKGKWAEYKQSLLCQALGTVACLPIWTGPVNVRSNISCLELLLLGYFVTSAGKVTKKLPENKWLLGR